MAVDSSRSSSTADSYIGSLISLTSKSEIRYEGILYDINTDESSIGLRNVRSFGTEGRKKDGPQVMPSDKVYEYILFRGSDIKDLQVKSNLPSQAIPPSDPAIIQSHYPRPASTSSLLAGGGGSLPDLSSHNPQMGQHSVSTFQGSLPLYQPGGNLSNNWGPSPPPSASGNGLGMPMYWPGPGFYGPPNSLPQFQQQSLLRPPPGLPMPPSLQQQPMQYPGFNASLPSNLPEYPSLGLTSNLPLSLTATSLSNSSLPPLPTGMLGSDSISSLVPNKGLSVGVPSLSPLTTSTPDVNQILPPMYNKPNAISTPTFPSQGLLPHPVPSVVGKSNSAQSETATPSLVTPGQLMQFGKIEASLSQSSQTAHKDVEVVQVAPTPAPAPEPPAPVPSARARAEAQPPLLPTPAAPSRNVHKPNGTHYQPQPRHSYRGRERGRGSGSSRPVMKFNEEFDFMAMNEKFNKDEVWGHLGKSNKSSSKEDGNGSDDDYESQDESDSELPKFEVKPLYSKDDFFDSLSSNALDNQSNHGRTKYSEQMKIDTETFGEFSRYRGGRGGRGPFRGGGRSRGSYYGRGYGYMGRGRGRSMPSRDF